MAYKVFRKGGYFYIVDTVTGRERDGLAKDVRVTKGTTSGDIFYINGVNDWSNDTPLDIADIQDELGDAYTVDTFTRFYESVSSVDVNLQSSTSPLVIIKATQLLAETTLTTSAVVDNDVITVDSVSGASVGDVLTIYSTLNNRVSFFRILSISVNNITLDSPIDFAYEVGSFVQFGNSNMAVNGSVTPVVFGVRNPTAQDIDFAVDFTRMIVSMELSGAGDYDEFGNIPALTNGLVCRFVDGRKQNIFNIKDNREFDNLMYDFKFIPATANAPDGINGRFTFEKLGSVVRLNPFEDLQFIVQDDLTGITKFEILLEGAGVTE